MHPIDRLSSSALSYSSIINSRDETPSSGLYSQERLETRMQRIMQSSFKAQINDYRHFRQYGMGDIVVLVGTSTAGKTSIIQALKKLESDRVEDGGDLRGLAIDLKNIKKHSHEEVKILEKVFKEPFDIAKAVFSPERAWKADISSQEKTEAEAAIERIRLKRGSFSVQEQEEDRASYENLELEMFDDAFEYSRRGGKMIFDVLSIDTLAKHVIARNFDGPLRVVLTYCPFHILSSRMEKRNQEAQESGEFSNQRIGAFPLGQFGEIYSQRKENQAAFESLTRDQVTKAFNDNFDKGIEAARGEGHSMPPQEQIEKDKERLRSDLLKKLGFKEGIDQVEIAPKRQQLYDLILDSSKMLPEESAKLIHKGTDQRYMK